MSWNQYARLARQLDELYRDDERLAAGQAAAREAVERGVATLSGRLGAQRQRLEQLAGLIGQPLPLSGPATVGGIPGQPGVPAQPGPAGLPGQAGSPGFAGQPGHAGLPGQAGAAGLPGPAGPAGPAGPVSPAGPVAPMSPAGPIGTTGQPGPGGQAGFPGPVGPADPAQELRLAHQHADLADAQTAETERLAQQPALLPDASPLSRNLLVYAGCAVVAVVAQYALLVVSNVGHVGALVLLGWLCAGFPLLAWGAGYLILGRVGRPAIGDANIPRNPRLGLLICFLAMPVAFCAFEAVTHIL